MRTCLLQCPRAGSIFARPTLLRHNRRASFAMKHPIAALGQQREAPTPSSSEVSPMYVLTQRLLAGSKPGEGRALLLAASLLGVAALAVPEAVQAQETYHQHAQLLADVAEGADFWSNVLRYVSYFFSVLLGTAYVALKPLADLFKRPATALLALGGIAGLIYFVNFTVQAMLGVQDAGFDYDTIARGL